MLKSHGVGSALIVSSLLLVGCGAPAAPTTTPAASEEVPSPPTIVAQWTQSAPMANMTQFAPPCGHVEPPFCYFGWRDPIPSPNGEYLLIRYMNHYGWETFAVLTSDYSRIVYLDYGTGIGTMSPGGCAADDWQPDGHLLFRCQTGDTSAKHRLDPETGQVDVVCTGGTPVFSSLGPAWSPDGQQIAFIVRSAYTPPTLYVVDVDGSHLQALTPVYLWSPFAWSPDGEQIAFVASADDLGIMFRLAVIHPDGTGLREVVSGPNLRDPRWSPDGRQIAFAEWHPEDDVTDHWIYLVNADGSDLKRLDDWPRWAAPGGDGLQALSERAGAISPGGEMLAYVDGSEIYLMPAGASSEGQEAVNLTGPLAAAFDYPCQPPP